MKSFDFSNRFEEDVCSASEYRMSSFPSNFPHINDYMDRCIVEEHEPGFRTISNEYSKRPVYYNASCHQFIKYAWNEL